MSINFIIFTIIKPSNLLIYSNVLNLIAPYMIPDTINWQPQHRLSHVLASCSGRDALYHRAAQKNLRTSSLFSLYMDPPE